MDYKSLAKLIIEGIQEAQKTNTYYKTIYLNKEIKSGRNEFLFFIKPEITIESDKIYLDKILDLIFQKIKNYSFNIHDVRILSAKYLDDYKLISAHYGVINKLSSDACRNISADAKNKFEKIFNKSAADAFILGSLEFMKLFPEISPLALDILSQNVKSEKIAPGTYIQRIMADGKELFLVNAFHPRQLEHFTANGRSIVTFTLSSDLSWKTARNEFIGKTNPADAVEGSIRNELLMQKEILGLESVSSSRNGAHLSAGPVEALVELIRYNSDYSKNERRSLNEYSFGKKLHDNFSEDKIDCFLSNCNVKYDDKIVSVFDLTEEWDSDQCIEILQKADLY